jgi:hypothetical protein
MTTFLVLEQIVFAREAFDVTFARGDRAAMRLVSVYFACVPVKPTLVAESRMFTT